LQSLGIDKGSSVVEILIDRKQKRISLVSAERSCERSLIELPLLLRLLIGERVPSIENGVAEQEVDGTVKIGRAALGDNLESRSAGPRK
jgi:hypothetical protein